MITIVAKLKAIEGKQDELKKSLTTMIAAVKANEPGVPVYSLHTANDDPTLFMFYEQYVDADAQKAHGTTDHMKAFGASLRGVLDGRPQIEAYTQIDGVS